MTLVLRKYTLLLLAIILLAASVRLPFLGSRPLHHDEAIHAMTAYDLYLGGPYRYDPAYHGPLRYYVNAFVYFLFGSGDALSRVVPALFGVALVALFGALRRWIGAGGALVGALLVAVSPSFTYYSRFLRDDIYVVVFTFLFVLAVLLFRQDEKPRYMYLAAASVALSFTAMENSYITVGMFALYLVAGWVIGGPRLEPARLFLRRHRLTLLRSAAIFVVIYVTFYTSWFTNPGGLWEGIFGSLRYWIGQHRIERIGGPFFYYVPLLGIYELPIVILGLAGLVYFLLRRRRLTTFLIYWTVASFLAYSYAGEKVPWLILHILLPLTLLAAAFSTVLLSRIAGARGRSVALVAISLGALWSLRTDIQLNFEHDPDPVEPLIYVQTSRQVRSIVARVDEISSRLGAGNELEIVIEDDCTWPLCWYLRKRTHISYPVEITQSGAPVIIAAWENREAVNRVLGRRYIAERYKLREWWNSTVEDRSLRRLWRFYFYREPLSPLGSYDVLLYVRRDLAAQQERLVSLPSLVGGASGEALLPQSEIVLPLAVWGQEHPHEIDVSREGGPSGEGEAAVHWSGEDLGLREPRDVAVDGDGRLYIADTGNDRIVVLAATGRLIDNWGGSGEEPGSFNEPCGIAVGRDGLVYVADTWNHRVQVFSGDGELVRVFDPGERGFWGPRGVAVGPWGRIYVTDTGMHRVVVFDRDGTRVAEWGEKGWVPGQFVEPVGIAFDAWGHIWIADTGNHRLQVFDTAGRFLREWAVPGWGEEGEPFREPYLDTDGQGNVYVTDPSRHRILVLDGRGEYRFVLGDYGGGPGQFDTPIGVAVGDDGRLYVTDVMNNRVQVFDLADVVGEE